MKSKYSDFSSHARQASRKNISAMCDSWRQPVNSVEDRLDAAVHSFEQQKVVTDLETASILNDTLDEIRVGISGESWQ